VTFKVPDLPQQAVESQTQFEPELSIPGSQSLVQPSFSKRKSADSNDGPTTNTKRMKISIGVGINLED